MLKVNRLPLFKHWNEGDLSTYVWTVVFHLGFVVFAPVHWFNLQISKRQHSLKIFERDETRVVQLLLLKPLCISHALVVSLQSIGNSYWWIQCRITSLVSKKIFKCQFDKWFPIAPQFFFSIYILMSNKLMLRQWEPRITLNSKGMHCHEYANICQCCWTKAVDWDCWWGVERLSLPIKVVLILLFCS